MFHFRIETQFLLPAVLGLAMSSQGIQPSSAPEQAPAAQELAQLSLHVRGFPREGQPLELRVGGPPATPFRVLVDAGQAFAIVGVTGADGNWRKPFRAPRAGTEMRLIGLASKAGSLEGFADLRIAIQPAFAAVPGDVVITEIQRLPDASGELRGAWIEIYNRTDYEIDLAGWMLRDDEGHVHSIASGDRGAVLSSRGFALLGTHGGMQVRFPLGSFELDPTADQIVVEDASGLTIDRVAYDVRAGWPEARPDASMQLALDRVDARANDEPSAWIQAATGGASVGQITAGNSPGRATPCIANGTALADVPDLSFFDTNCDGIDGDISRAVFVAKIGLPTNPGTMANPLTDLQVAIDLAAADPSRDHVYVSEGIYAGPFVLADGVSVWGGYSQVNGWKRSQAHVTELTAAVGLPNGMVGVVGSNLASPITLGSVTVKTFSAAPLLSNYGILLQQADDVTLEGVQVVTGMGGSGLPGSNGIAGTNGSAGKGGGTSCGFNYCNGTGGAGANAGGSGGEGGRDFHPNGYSGASGAGPAGGAGGSGGGWISAGLNGKSGGAGTNGSAGLATSNAGTLTAGWWVPNGDGLAGGNGGHGSGGGGGGGGSADFFLTSGNGGGGGGGGGFGATSGKGGRAGGSSFAVCLWQSQVAIESCNLNSGAGRNGGTGGFSATGGLGGSGGAGNNCCNVPFGGNGGAGGKGGNSGAGAGGGGGHSYGIVLDPLSTMTLANSTVIAGAAGLGGTSPAGGPSNGKNGDSLPVKQL